MSEEIRLRFAGSFADGLEFVEAEDEDGNSIKVGTWERDGDFHILAFDPEDSV